MCGYAGFYNPQLQTIQFDLKKQEALQASLVHRGPDDGKTYLHEEGLFCFSHRRLSIIDTSSLAAQPMWNDAKTAILAYNGEIYNNCSIRKELEEEGIVFKSHSDTETVLYSMQQWGIKGLHRLRGMFSFAYFDLVEKRLFLVRDRFGIKPLYFSFQKGIWSFASEIKALRVFDFNTFDINPHSVDHYLTFMTTPAPLTLYKNVYKLPAGYLCEIDHTGNATVTQWYSVLQSAQMYPSSLYSDEATCIETTRYLLQQSVKEHMYSDVPVGAFLSGGIDSSLNVALMSQYSSKIKTFTVAMENNEDNELQWASKVAEQFSTEHHEMIITDSDAAHFYEAMVEQVDEPLADAVNIPFYFVAQKARQEGITVAQVGEAADELFFGYPVYERYAKLLAFEHGAKRLPNVVKKCGASLMQSLFPYHGNYNELLQSWLKEKPLFLSGAVAFHPFAKERFLPSYEQYEDELLAKLFPSFPYHRSSFDIVEYHQSILGQYAAKGDPVQKIMFLELSQRLPDLLLMRADKMSMLTSVEARVPFLDHRLVEYLFFMPEEIKTNGYQRKYLLKKVAEGLIPDEIIHRKKVGFAAPVTTWMQKGSSFNTLIASKSYARSVYCMRYAAYKKVPQTIAPSLQAVQDWTIQNLLTTLQQNTKSSL